jgi:hypothetical protein
MAGGSAVAPVYHHELCHPLDCVHGHGAKVAAARFGAGGDNTVRQLGGGLVGRDEHRGRILEPCPPARVIDARLIVSSIDGLGRCGAAPEVILGPLKKTSQKRLSRALMLNTAYA